jgi:hypothetical protein
MKDCSPDTKDLTATHPSTDKTARGDLPGPLPITVSVVVFVV